MVGDSRSTVKFVNPHLMKIDVVKFDDKKNFEMWRCEVIDARMATNLEDTLRLKKKPEKTSEQDVQDRMWSHKVLFDIRHQVSCVV